MRSHNLLSWASMIFCAAVISGCTGITLWPLQKASRTEVLNHPMEANQTLIVSTKFGRIKVIGQDTNSCSIRADLYAEAPGKNEAQTLLTQIQPVYECQGDIHEFHIQVPQTRSKRKCGAHLTITLPYHARIHCDTEFGKIQLTHLDGETTATTEFGNITCDDIKGPLSLHTEFGRIEGKDIQSPDIRADTEFGDIKLFLCGTTQHNIQVNASTEFGNIHIVTNKTFSGQIDAQTEWGSSHCSIPLIQTSHKSRSTLQGTCGPGQGNMHLRTQFGSIKIK